jgi:hypothetical protein
MLDDNELERINETMGIFGEIGPFTSSRSVINAGEQSFEIVVVDETLSAEVLLEGGQGRKMRAASGIKEDFRSPLGRWMEVSFV